jgi:hypothetical protein
MSDQAVNKLAGVIVAIALVLGLGQVAGAPILSTDSGWDCGATASQTCGDVRYFEVGAIAV